MSKRLGILCAVFLLISALPMMARAAETPWFSADHLQGRLVSGTVLADKAGYEALFEVRLEQGWHTYWRNPGDAGLPPRFDWTGSENIENVEVLWPAPGRKLELDFHTFAYTEAVAFPLVVKLKEPGKISKLALKAEIMVCNEICVPQTLNLELLVPVDGAEGGQKVIDFAKTKLPVADTEALGIETVVAGPEGLVITAHAAGGFEGADVFITVGDIAFTAPPQITVNADEPVRAMIKVAPPADIESTSAFLTGKELVIVLTAPGGAIEKKIAF